MQDQPEIESLDAPGMHKIINSDCFHAIPRLSRRSVDLAVFSPPYAQQRKKLYAGVGESDYPGWMLRLMGLIEPVLKPHGSVMMVIRPHVKDGAVSDYVLRTQLLLHDHGWKTPYPLVWMKPDGLPTGRKDRPRAGHEQILWFTRHPKDVFCDPKANGTPSNRIAELKGARDGNGKGFSGTRNGTLLLGGKGFLSAYSEGKKRSRAKSVNLGLVKETMSDKPIIQGIARCSDVVRVAVSKCNKAEYNHHPAQHPADLYRWLIRLACPPNGLVLDPFGGSGTTMEAAFLEDRRSISIDLEPSYIDIIRKRHLDLQRDRQPSNFCTDDNKSATA